MTKVRRGFDYRNNELYCEEVKVATLAKKVKTPFYLYSRKALVNNYCAFQEAFRELDPLICYSYKANSNLSLCKILKEEGAGVDVVSGGELYKALRVGVDPKRIVFAGVGKTPEEIEYALKNDILLLNVESTAELKVIDKVAGKLKKTAPVALRINPAIDPHTHPHISTGHRGSKFGIEFVRALDVYTRIATELKNIEVLGVHAHIGSQITELEPFVNNLQKIVNLVRELEREGLKVRYLNIGGGLGIPYQDGKKVPGPREFAQKLLPLLTRLKYKIILEPGRAIVGTSGILITKVLYIKETKEKSFIIVDAAMNDFIRPAFYNAHHEVISIKRPKIQNSGEWIFADLVGPICESGDYFAKDRELPPAEPGDLVAILDTGAYGFSMSSNYNSRPRAAEVLVEGDKYRIIRKREVYQDLIRGEKI
jgi:diaminopimelate decarboxylase